jgi:transposase
MKKRFFSKDIKREAVRMVKAGQRPAAQIARDLGIQPALLYDWMRKLKDENPAADPGPSPEMAKELRRLQRENARLKEEREILKKATAFFVEESK